MARLYLGGVQQRHPTGSSGLLVSGQPKRQVENPLHDPGRQRLLPCLRACRAVKPSTPAPMKHACQLQTTGFDLQERRMHSPPPLLTSKKFCLVRWRSDDNALAETINGLYKAEVIGVDRGDRSRRSSSPPSNGWIGSTTGGSWSPSATFRRPKPRSATTPYWKSQPWRRDSNQTASGKPGAVHPRGLPHSTTCGWSLSFMRFAFAPAHASHTLIHSKALHGRPQKRNRGQHD